jgi:hypothetical protein
MEGNIGFGCRRTWMTRAFRLGGVPVGLGLAVAIVLALAASAGGATARQAAAPTNHAPPTISGTTAVGQVLSASPGSWNGTTPITFTYSWKQCDANGAACKNVPNNEHSTFTLVSTNSGNTMRVHVTATNADGAGGISSAQTAVISASSPPPTTTTTPASNGCTTSGGTVPIANVTSPAHLEIDGFQVNPSPVTFGTRTLSVRVHITGCGGNVQGALVYVTAVPYNMFGVPAEQMTGSDGWATLTMTALPGFPVSPKQGLLVMFIRARKDGEDLLGGISARRLVSFTVKKG